MKFSKDDIVNELINIERVFGFSDECTPELQSFLFDKGLVEDVEGCIMTTIEGDELLGYSKEELQDRYNDDGSNGFFYDFHEGETEDDNF